VRLADLGDAAHPHGLNRTFDRILDLSPASAEMRASLEPHLKPSIYIDGAALGIDEEALPFEPESFDLVVSNLALGQVNDLPGSLIQIRRILKPDGLLLAAMPGPHSLQELRAAFLEAELATIGGGSPHILPFAGAPEIGGLLQRAGFALPVVESEEVLVIFDDVLELLQHLRLAGFGNILHSRARHTMRKDTLAKLREIYNERFATGEGKVFATAEIVYLSGWAPAENQQKAIARGSAKHKLADAL
jgi:SAM-dependent methyltransferase